MRSLLPLVLKDVHLYEENKIAGDRLSWLFAANTEHAGFTPGEAEGAATEFSLAFGTRLCVGGNPDTAFLVRSTHAVVAVVGNAFLESPSSYRRLQQSDWEDLLAGKDLSEFVDSLGGHFVIAEASDDRLTVRTDRTGLRSCYLRDRGSEVCVSTNASWLASHDAPIRLDEKELYSHWFGLNQLSADSLYSNVERICRGASVTIGAGGDVVRNAGAGWGDVGADESGGNVLDALTRVLRSHDGRYALALSGGLDSRFLLAVLLGIGADVETFSFGAEDDLDVSIARQVAEAVSVKHDRIPIRVPGRAEALALLRRYAVDTCASTPVSAGLKLTSYDKVALDAVVIDGGFGEIIRAEFFKRLQVAATVPLVGKPEKVAAALEFVRADVLRDDVRARLRKEFEDEAVELAQRIRKSDSPRRSLNELAVETRLPNFYGYSQGWLDTQKVSFMPFAQLPVLRSVIASDGKVDVREHIRAHAPELAAIPVVKGDAIHPFGRGAVGKLIARMLRKTSPAKLTSEKVAALEICEEYARDRAASRDHLPIVDPQKVQSKVEPYYAGDRTAATFVDWWLAFDFWTQSFSGG